MLHIIRDGRAAGCLVGVGGGISGGGVLGGEVRGGEVRGVADGEGKLGVASLERGESLEARRARGLVASTKRLVRVDPLGE